MLQWLRRLVVGRDWQGGRRDGDCPAMYKFYSKFTAVQLLCRVYEPEFVIVRSFGEQLGGASVSRVHGFCWSAGARLARPHRVGVPKQPYQQQQG